MVWAGGEEEEKQGVREGDVGVGGGWGCGEMVESKAIADAYVSVMSYGTEISVVFLLLLFFMFFVLFCKSFFFICDFFNF